MAKGVAPFQIKRFKHEDHLRMLNVEAQIKVVNRRINSKLYQMFLTTST